MEGHYFKEHGRKIRYVLDDEVEDGYGLRRAQSGAIQAIGAHFALAEDGEGKEPALVVMPTGSGKTAVLMLAAFQLRANRVLVITPSRIVRDQITNEFSSLKTLRKLNVFPEHEETPNPRVKQQKGKVKSEDDWEELREFDVVVSTPRSTSPAMKDVAEPPSDLFDLILVDEAHHQPTKTWTELLRSFPNAKQASFTATPFRRDKEKVDGKLVFHYTIQQAREDGIYSQIHFEAAEDNDGEPDVAIAKKAEEVLLRDRNNGLKHYLMARAGSKKEANRLARVYEEHTGLNLRVIHSGHAYSRVERSIDDLKDEKIDGVICVDMLGEGFDFPRLKIAVLHTPHKSLPVTLQFVGRFARETDEETGASTFIAVQSDIEIESTRLFTDSAAWGEIIPELSTGRVEDELHVRETLDRFNVVRSNFEDIEELPLYSLTPYQHVKVYLTSGDVDLTNELSLPRKYKLVQRHDRDDRSAIVFVTRVEQPADWSQLEEFRSIEHDLFVVYHDSTTDLLFINASSKSIGLYESIATSFTSGDHRILPLYKLNRVLSKLSNPAFYNIGMRSRVQHSGNESYRITAGPRPHDKLTKTDGQLYHRGHVFGGGRREDSKVNIGFSSGAKIWSTSNLPIPKLLQWCSDLSTLLDNDEPVLTDTGLDNLPVGEAVREMPDAIIGAEWPSDAYMRPPRISYSGPNGTTNCLLLDLDVDAKVGQQYIRITISTSEVECNLRYSPDNFPFYEKDDHEPDLMLTRGVASDEERLVDYLNYNPLSIFLPDFTRVC